MSIEEKFDDKVELDREKVRKIVPPEISQVA